MLLGKKRTHPSTGMMKSGIVDSKSQLLEQRARQVMEIFQQQSKLIPNLNTLPTPQLNTDADLSSYDTPLLKKFSIDVNLIWSLAIALYKGKVEDWLRDLVSPGLSSQLEINIKQHESDKFISTFTYLSFGRRDLASEEAKKKNDFQLAMYISHSEFKNVKELVIDYINTLKLKGEWKTMSLYHKRCWYILSGELGYSEEDKLIITERVSWQCTLGMYIWYGNKFDDQGPSLDKYNRAFDNTIVNIQHLKAIKNLVKPDLSCLWYQLLQWWLSDMNLACIENWPLDLVWLLSIYHPSKPIDLKFKLEWINQLEKIDESELAIYATLFLANPDKQLDYILRQCEWNDESKLINEYYIPSKIICIAKALHAHDDWNFDEEYKILLQGQLYEQAKMNLLYFILPRYFKYDDLSIEKCLSFINMYPLEKDEFIKLLQNSLNYLLNNEKNTETSNLLVQKLQKLPPKYEGRNTKEFFKSLIDAILF